MRRNKSQLWTTGNETTLKHVQNGCPTKFYEKKHWQLHDYIRILLGFSLEFRFVDRLANKMSDSELDQRIVLFEYECRNATQPNVNLPINKIFEEFQSGFNKKDEATHRMRYWSNFIITIIIIAIGTALTWLLKT